MLRPARSGGPVVPATATVVTALALALVLVLVLVPEPATAQAAVVCAERGAGEQVCRLELAVSQRGEPPTVAVSVAGVAGGREIRCDRGPHYRPDPLAAQLREVPCSHPEYGWYSQAYDCYFTRASRAAPESPQVIRPDGYRRGDPGAVYRAMCYTASHPDIPADNYCFPCVPPHWFGQPQYLFLETAPAGSGGITDPVPALLVTAIEELALAAPEIGTAPPAGQGAGLVRLPVWLWNEVSAANWGTRSRTAGPVAGVTVVARARAAGIEWDPGDGATVHCDEGVAWRSGMDIFDPPCGHSYPRSSRDRPGGRYGIAATTSWAVRWWTEGLPDQRGGALVLRATARTSLRIDEVQVVNADSRHG